MRPIHKAPIIASLVLAAASFAGIEAKAFPVPPIPHSKTGQVIAPTQSQDNVPLSEYLLGGIVLAMITAPIALEEMRFARQYQKFLARKAFKEQQHSI